MAGGQGSMPGGPGGGMPPAGGGGGAGTGALVSGLMSGDKSGGTTPGNKKEKLSNILMNWVLPAAGAYAASYGGGEQRAANIMLAYLEKNKEEAKKRKLGQKIVGIADKYRVADLNTEKAMWNEAKPTLDPSTDTSAGVRMKDLKQLPLDGPIPADHTETPKMPESMKTFGRDLSSFLKKSPEPVVNPVYDMVGELAASGDTQGAISLLSDRQAVIDKVKSDTMALEAQKSEAKATRNLQKALAEANIEVQRTEEAGRNQRHGAELSQARDFHTAEMDFKDLERKDLIDYRDKMLALDADKIDLDRERLGVERGSILLGNTQRLADSLLQAYSYGQLDLPTKKDEETGKPVSMTVDEAMQPIYEKMGELEALVNGADYVYKPGGGVMPVGGGGGAAGASGGAASSAGGAADPVLRLNNIMPSSPNAAPPTTPPPSATPIPSSAGAASAGPSDTPRPSTGAPGPMRLGDVTPVGNAPEPLVGKALIKLSESNGDPEAAFMSMVQEGLPPGLAAAAVKDAIRKAGSGGQFNATPPPSGNFVPRS